MRSFFSVTGEHSYSEIREGCTVIANMIENPIDLSEIVEQISRANQIYFVGCGSSYWAGIIGKYILLDAGVDIKVEYASEFMVADFPIDNNSLVIGISQSGETTETVQALEQANKLGGQTAAITNESLSRVVSVADVSIVTPAGDERAIMATKTVDAAITSVYLMANQIKQDKNNFSLVNNECENILEMDLSSEVQFLSQYSQIYTLGMGKYYGIAGEASTKLSEGPLFHTIPLPTLEVRHGPIANASGKLAIIFAFGGLTTEVIQSVIDELSDAGAESLVIHPREESYDAEETIAINKSISTVLPLLKLTQRLAHKSALTMDLDPDDPPALSKYVEISKIE